MLIHVLIASQGKVGEVLRACTISAPRCGHRRQPPLHRRLPGFSAAAKLWQRRPAVRRRLCPPPEGSKLCLIAGVARRGGRQSHLEGARPRVLLLGVGQGRRQPDASPQRRINMITRLPACAGLLPCRSRHFRRERGLPGTVICWQPGSQLEGPWWRRVVRVDVGGHLGRDTAWRVSKHGLYKPGNVCTALGHNQAICLLVIMLTCSVQLIQTVLMQCLAHVFLRPRSQQPGLEHLQSWLLPTDLLPHTPQIGVMPASWRAFMMPTWTRSPPEPFPTLCVPAPRQIAWLPWLP